MTFARVVRLTAAKQVVPTPRRNLKVTQQIWGLKIPRKRTCEHPRQLDSAAYTPTDIYTIQACI